MTTFSFSQNASDTTRAGTFFRKALSLKDSVEFEAMQYADSAVMLGIACKHYPVVVDGLLLKGRMHMDENRLSLAFEEFQKADDYCLISGDSLRLSKCMNSMGDVYKQLHMTKEAVDYIDKSIHLAERIGNADALAAYCNKMGHVYMDWGEASKDHRFFDKALTYYNRSLNVNIKSGNQRLLCTSYVNLANSFLVRIKHGADSSFASRSIEYSLKGIEIARKNKMPDEVALNTLNVGEAFLINGEYDKALLSFNTSFGIYKSLKLVLWEAATLRNLALAYSGKGETDKAIALVEEANRLMIAYSHTEQFDNYRLLSSLYEKKNDFKKSLEAYRKYKQLEDIENNVRSTIQIERTHIERSILEKDNKILQLQTEMLRVKKEHDVHTLLNYILAFVVLLAAMVVSMLFFRGRILRRAKDLSDKARAMQEQFVANTSHELRTPLNGIIGMTAQLQQTHITEKQSEYLDIIRASSGNLLRMINDLLDLSKINAGKMDFMERNFALHEFFNRLYIQLKSASENKKITLEFDVSKDLPSVVSGDSMRLQQILTNLLENAIKFTEKGFVRLKVSVAEHKKQEVLLAFEVTDSGPGIPKEKLNLIFQSFVQLEHAGKRIHGGSGLGLAIARFLTESQRGKITVSSEPGKGSVFTVLLPFKVADASSNLQSEEQLPANSSYDLHMLRILVVEDNRINQRVIETTLERWNCEYVIVDSAVKAFEELYEQKFDLVLMDIELPSISGIEAAKYIREKFTNENRQVPIIALTAYVMESERNKCIEAGMNDLVTKPFDQHELYAKILRVTGKSDLQSDEGTNDSLNTEEFSFSYLQIKYEGRNEELYDLLNLFLTELPEYADEIKTALSEKNAVRLKQHLHKVKSPAGLFGKNKLTSAIELAEKSLLTEITNDSEKCIKEVLNYLEKLEVAITDFIKKTRS